MFEQNITDVIIYYPVASWIPPAILMVLINKS